MRFVYNEQGNNEKTLVYLNEAYDLQVKSESIYLVSTCISISSIHHSKQDHKNALIYYDKALKYVTNDGLELGLLYYQIRMIYDDKKDLDWYQ